MQLHLITPEHNVLDESVQSVTIPGLVGEMQVLPGHTYLLGLTKQGMLSCELASGEIRNLEVGPGHVEVYEDVVTVAVESAL